MASISVAQISDLPSLMCLIRSMRKACPWLKNEERVQQYERTMVNCIAAGGGLCVKEKETVVAVLLFSRQDRELTFLGVSPRYRRQGLATELIKKMLEYLGRDGDIRVNTYRPEDPLGDGVRSLYDSFGFVPGALVEKGGYPRQEMILPAISIKQ